MAELFNEEIISQATTYKMGGQNVHFAREIVPPTSGANVPGRKKERDMVSFLWQSISPQAVDVLQDGGVHRQTVPSP